MPTPKLTRCNKEKTSFWKTCPFDTWDTTNGVGIRNHFTCTAFASIMMVNNKSGLIFNISSAGGIRYLFDVAYGVGKVSLDRMAAYCAAELIPHNVVIRVSLTTF